MRELFTQHKIIPVLVFSDPAQGSPAAIALAAGGIPIIEVTLRTDAAWEALSNILKEVPGFTVGVGTVLESDQLKRAKDCGAAFAVSPGFDPVLAEEAHKLDIFYLPGVATASEIMLARRAGFRFLKFFPAAVAGGISALSGFASPFREIEFCPTGGVGQDNLADYLVLPNVACVGGSWLATADDLTAEDWPAIEKKARDAVAAAHTC